MSADGATSDVLGTVLLLAVALTILGALASGLLDDDAAPAPPRLEVVASARQGASEVKLMKVGGADVGQKDVRVLVAVNEVLSFDGPLRDSESTWRLGDVARIPLPQRLSTEDRLEVSLVWRPGAATLSHLRVAVSESGEAAPQGGGHVGIHEVKASSGSGAGWTGAR